jgi:hypothetical protein
MKLLINQKPCQRFGPAAGFTLLEAFYSSTLFCVLLVGAAVSMQIFGMRIYTLGGTKLSATAGALKVLDHVRNDIRGALTSDIGNLSTVSDPSTFSLCPTNTLIEGAALRLYPTTNSVPFTVYYLDTSTATNNFMMANTSDGVNFTTTKLASYITNQIVFSEEDCAGNLLTSYVNNRIIRMELDFYQWEYPVGYVGGSGANAYDNYRLTTRISRRLLQ